MALDRATMAAIARVAELKAGLRAETKVGIHAHDNLSLAVANTIGALEEGVDHVAGCCTRRRRRRASVWTRGRSSWSSDGARSSAARRT